MFLKDPDAILDYRVDWASALEPGIEIASSHWTVVPAEAGGLVLIAEAVSDATASVRVGGGKSGHVYQLGNRVVLSDASVDERSLVLRVEDR